MRHALFVLGLATALAGPAAAQDADPGRRAFETRCGRCHGADGTGTEMGPAIVQRLKARDNAQLGALIHDGLPLRGMPPSVVPEAELAALIRYLRTIERDPAPEAAPRA